MVKQNVLITGSNGMLGKDVVKLFNSKDLYNIYGINRFGSKKPNIKEYICDLTNHTQVKKILEEIEPDIIINCAANVNVDSCEENKEYAYKINAEVPKFLASYKPVDTKFIYVSTDSVFNGINGDYNEKDRTNPLNYYAYTKLEGEKLSLEENQNTVVIRTNIYGYHVPEQNSLVEWAFSNLKKGNSISGFQDVFFNPVYTKQLAEVIHILMTSNFKGLINVGSDEKLSKYEFLKKLAYEFEIDTKLVKANFVDSIKFKAKRPKNTTLNTKKINDLLDIDLSLEHGIKELYKDYLY